MGDGPNQIPKRTVDLVASPFGSAKKIFVSDFDGTITERDFYLLVGEHLLPDNIPDFWQLHLDGKISIFDVLAGIFASIEGDEARVMEVARRAGIDPRFASSVDRLRAGGWEVVVASIGCEWYIRRLLAEHGAEVTVFANPGRLLPGGGLEMKPLRDSPFASEIAGVDKAAIVRAAGEQADVVAFAGDSRPDYEAAMTVEPEYRFARHGLAEIFRRKGIPFRPFKRWTDIPAQLLGESDA